MTDNDQDSILQLSNTEARVLGALMEKQLTTPEAYPLTLNSLVLACNQKTSREPVTNFGAGQTQQTVNDLRERKLIDVEYGSRADRYEQRLSRQLYLDRKGQALLTVMLLRGPQTSSELYNRTQRMVEFASPEEVEETLQVMCQKTRPIIRRIPRQTGQREDRYVHLLSGEPDLSALKQAPVSSKRAGNDELIARIEALEAMVHKLMAANGLDKNDQE
jgi:uncharacterized protein